VDNREATFAALDLAQSFLDLEADGEVRLVLIAEYDHDGLSIAFDDDRLRPDLLVDVLQQAADRLRFS
jgi:hypothetical protein